MVSVSHEDKSHKCQCLHDSSAALKTTASILAASSCRIRETQEDSHKLDVAVNNQLRLDVML